MEKLLACLRARMIWPFTPAGLASGSPDGRHGHENDDRNRLYLDRHADAVSLLRGGVHGRQRPDHAPVTGFKHFGARGLPGGERAAVSLSDRWQLPDRAAAIYRCQQKLPLPASPIRVCPVPQTSLPRSGGHRGQARQNGGAPGPRPLPAGRATASARRRPAAPGH